MSADHRRPATTVKIAANRLGQASHRLFGANLEWISDVPEAITSERLVII